MLPNHVWQEGLRASSELDRRHRPYNRVIDWEKPLNAWRIQQGGYEIHVYQGLQASQMVIHDVGHRRRPSWEIIVECWRWMEKDPVL